MKHARSDYNERIQDSAGIIPVDEPVFLLRGQDELAADLVEMYAHRLEAECIPGNKDHIEAILRHATAMRVWRPKKLPDCPK